MFMHNFFSAYTCVSFAKYYS